MRGLRRLAMGLALMAFAGAALGGCSVVAGIGDAVTGAPSVTAINTVASAEQAYTAAASLAATYLKSGNPTKAQAATIAKLDATVYADLVAARTAVANNDSPAVAVALASFNQDLPAFSAALSNGSAP